ncbi:hypothetical protein CERSUDRAFT_73950 [Gelatoporia subvermispora B]|uniref:Uncharacterized protein n=1 Tax=Ceriporiopsis subvermispora (strain B) TaxID=914234 RepID=M2QIT7_CERS8|nr:hypothetical protein CERSUDRAFT_73950 [Gelatoporia subvermispora B]
MSRKRVLEADDVESGRKRKRLPKGLRDYEGNIVLWGQHGILDRNPETFELHDMVIDPHSPGFERADFNSTVISATTSSSSEVHSIEYIPTLPPIGQHVSGPSNASINSPNLNSSMNLTQLRGRMQVVYESNGSHINSLQRSSITPVPTPQTPSGPPPVPYCSRPDMPATSLYETRMSTPSAIERGSCDHHPSGVQLNDAVDATGIHDTPLISMSSPITQHFSILNDEADVDFNMSKENWTRIVAQYDELNARPPAKAVVNSS